MIPLQPDHSRDHHGESIEVLEHHARQHERHCPGLASKHGVFFRCPCRNTVVVICGACGGIIFYAVPGAWCRHADALARGEAVA